MFWVPRYRLLLCRYLLSLRCCVDTRTMTNVGIGDQLWGIYFLSF